MNRFALALKSFWNVLRQPQFAHDVEALMLPRPTGPDLRVLAVLQRDGRLVDFLLEDIDAYGDAQIGAAVRDIHRGCRKALKEYLVMVPVVDQPEDSPVTVPADFDPATIQLSGQIAGAPPYRGTLRHHGWRVRSTTLPELPRTRDDSSIIAPAEVEVS